MNIFVERENKKIEISQEILLIFVPLFRITSLSRIFIPRKRKQYNARVSQKYDEEINFDVFLNALVQNFPKH